MHSIIPFVSFVRHERYTAVSESLRTMHRFQLHSMAPSRAGQVDRPVEREACPKKHCYARSWLPL